MTETKMSETHEKLARLRALLASHALDALVLGRVANFAWLAEGAASYVNTATTFGGVSLVIAPDAQYILTNNIEATRLAAEEPVEAWASSSWSTRGTGQIARQASC
jgi:hypothetical protein